MYKIVKNNKSSGYDNILNEYIKLTAKVLMPNLYNIFQFNIKQWFNSRSMVGRYNLPNL